MQPRLRYSWRSSLHAWPTQTLSRKVRYRAERTGRESTLEPAAAFRCDHESAGLNQGGASDRALQRWWAESPGQPARSLWVSLTTQR